MNTEGMSAKELELTRKLLKAERRVRRLQKEQTILATIRNREELLKNIAVEERKKKSVEIDQVIATIASTVDAKDEDTNGHSMRVADYSRKIAVKMGLSKKLINDIYQAALLHDVGKIGIPDAVLKKNGRLTDEEYSVIKSHTIKGREILHFMKTVPVIADGAYYHHERWDGKGYPQGLIGLDIPLIGRIIAVADVYDALTSKRCYKEAMGKDEVRQELIKGAGTQFDPKIVGVFLKCIEESAQ